MQRPDGASQARRAKLAEFATAWAIRLAAITAGAAIWAAILSRNSVGRPLFLEVWAAYAWLLTSVVVGLACGGYLAQAIRPRAGLRRVLWPIRIVVFALIASYAVGLLVPPTGPGVANPAAYPAVLAIGAAVGFLRRMVASASRRDTPRRR